MTPEQWVKPVPAFRLHNRACGLSCEQSQCLLGTKGSATSSMLRLLCVCVCMAAEERMGLMAANTHALCLISPFILIWHAGTYNWAAPELLMGSRISSAADMFSFGVMLLELTTHQEQRRGFYHFPRWQQTPSLHSACVLLQLIVLPDWACRLAS